MKFLFVKPEIILSDFFTTHITFDAKVSVDAIYVIVETKFGVDLGTKIKSHLCTR